MPVRAGGGLFQGDGANDHCRPRLHVQPAAAVLVHITNPSSKNLLILSGTVFRARFYLDSDCCNHADSLEALGAKFWSCKRVK